MRAIAAGGLLVALAGCAAVQTNRLADGQQIIEGDVTEAGIGGMTVLVKRLPHEPVTSCQLFVRGGVRNWTAANAGVEKLALEVAVNGGVEGLAKPAFQARLAALGTQLGAESGEDFAVLGFKSLDRNFQDAFELLVRAFLFPLLPDEEVALQRELMLSELRQEGENPDALLSRVLHEQLFRGLPYAWRASGTPETLNSLTRDDLVRHLAFLRTSSRLLLVVVGDVDPARVVALARQGLGHLPRGDYLDSPLQAPRPAAPKALLVDRPLPTDYLIEAFPAPTWGSPEMPVGVVAMSALREDLFEEIRTRRELSYAPSAGLSIRGLGEGYLYLTAVDVPKAVEVMHQVVQQYQSGQIDPERLEGNKRIFLTNFLMQNETTNGQGDLLASAELIGGNWRLARDLPSRVKDVRAPQVAAFLTRYLRNLQTVLIGKTAGLKAELFER